MLATLLAVGVALAHLSPGMGIYIKSPHLKDNPKNYSCSSITCNEECQLQGYSEGNCALSCDPCDPPNISKDRRCVCQGEKKEFSVELTTSSSSSADISKVSSEEDEQVNPETKPSNPKTEPENPETKPENPETESGNSEPEPENPETEPENTEPENPETKPRNPETENPFTENPFTENPFTENPFTENPFTENPFTENPFTETEKTVPPGGSGEETDKMKPDSVSTSPTPQGGNNNSPEREATSKPSTEEELLLEGEEELRKIVSNFI